MEIVHVNIQALPGCPETPVIMHVHGHKWRDMKLLVKSVVMPLMVTHVCLIYDIAILLCPWRIMDFNYYALHLVAILIKTVIKGHWIETMSEVTKMA